MLGALPPPNRLPTPDLPLSGAHHPGAGQIGRRLSTSAIITVLQHDHGPINHPATGRGCPLRGGCGQPCTSRCTAGRAGSEPGAAEGVSPSPAPPLRSLAGELCPVPVGSGTSCHRSAPGLAGGAGRQVEEPKFPRIRRRTAREHRPLEGCSRYPSAKKSVSRAPEVPSIDKQPDGLIQILHRLFAACGVQVLTPLESPPAPGALTCPGRATNRPAGGLAKTRPTTRSQRPVDFYE